MLFKIHKGKLCFKNLKSHKKFALSTEQMVAWSDIMEKVRLSVSDCERSRGRTSVRLLIYFSGCDNLFNSSLVVVRLRILMTMTSEFLSTRQSVRKE